MGFDEGRIVLDSDNGAYYPGQTVHGKLIFEEDKVKTCRGIYIQMKGYCYVFFITHESRRVNGHTERRSRTHRAYEQYYDRKMYFVGREHGECHIQPGKYEYPFECPLPLHCPSSFEGHFGHIRYEFKVVVDRAMKLDQEKTVLIRVFAPADLNMNPVCREPVQFEFRDSYCCWCVTSGTCETLVKLPVSGYCPGQVMPIEINCTNNSNVKIKAIKLAIKKDIAYHAIHLPGLKVIRETVAEIKKGPVPGRTTRSWTVQMDVPAMDIYNVDACRYIDIIYEFKVQIQTGWCHSNNEECRRIIFGTIPLVGFQDNVQNPLQDQMPKNPPPKVGYAQQPMGTPALPEVLHMMPFPGNPSAPFPDALPYPTNSPYTIPNAPYPETPGGNQPANNFPIGPPNLNSPYPPPLVGNPYPGDSLPSNTPYPIGTPNLIQKGQEDLNTTPYPASGPNVASSPYPSGPNVASPPYPSGSNVASPPYPSDPNVSSPPYPTGPNVSSPPYPTGPNVASPPYPTGPNLASPYPTGSSPYPSRPAPADPERPNENDGATMPLLPPGRTATSSK